MKKFVVFVLGLTLVGGVVSGVVSASRLKYHQYVKSHVRDQQLVPSNVHPKVRSFTQMKPRNSQRRVVHTSPMRRGHVVAHQLCDTFTEFVTYTNNAFSLEVPVQWSPEFPASHKFVSDLEDYSINVKVFDPVVCESANSFYSCASTLSENENYNTLSGRGKLMLQSSITRMNQYQNTVLHSREQTQTYTESFIAQKYGKKLYFNRYFVEGVDGKVFMVETQANANRIEDFLGVSKVIFDSFRVYGDQPLLN